MTKITYLLLVSLSFSFSTFVSKIVVAEEYNMEEDGEQRAIKAAARTVGKTAPMLSLTSIDGKQLDLNDSYGKKPIYLKFWATWCVPCGQQMPKFKEIYRTYKDEMTIVAVNTGFNDDLKSAKKYVKQKKLLMPVVIDDGTLAGIFKLKVTPMHVLIGRDGKILHIGHKDGEKLDLAFKTAINQKVKVQPKSKKFEKLNEIKIGDIAKELSFKNLDGKSIIVSKSSGKFKVLAFFAPWCESYLAESRPKMAKTCKETRLKVDELLPKYKQVEWYGISSNLWVDKFEVVDYKKTTKTKLDLSYDENAELFRYFSIKKVPTLIILDKENKIIHRVESSFKNLDSILSNSIK